MERDRERKRERQRENEPHGNISGAIILVGELQHSLGVPERKQDPFIRFCGWNKQNINQINKKIRMM